MSIVFEVDIQITEMHKYKMIYAKHWFIFTTVISDRYLIWDNFVNSNYDCQCLEAKPQSLISFSKGLSAVYTPHNCIATRIQ